MITFLLIVLVLFILITVLAFIAPKSYEVNRSIIVNKSISEVFNYVKYTKNQNHWSPWKKKDPNMKQFFEGVDGEVGFISKWEGNKEVGAGEQEIKQIVENKIIETELRFEKPWKSVSDAYLKVEEVTEKETKIIWGFAGNNPIPMNILMLFFSFEKAVGKDFEEGLTNLKAHLESK